MLWIIVIILLLILFVLAPEFVLFLVKIGILTGFGVTIAFVVALLLAS